MLLINKRQLVANALNDKSHDMHEWAKEYDAGRKYLQDTYGDSIKFVRPGYPKRGKGIDHRGKDVPNMAMPTPPMMIPLTAEVEGKTGMEIWSCSLGAPILLPNGLYEIGGKKSLTITESYTVNMKREPDLGFFLYYKSPFHNAKKGKGQLVINDPVAKAKQQGDLERAMLELQTGLYGVLADESQLRIVAQSYGVTYAEKKHPDVLRSELKKIILDSESKKKKDPLHKGIKEFLADLKVTDAVRLRSLVTRSIDKKLIQYYPDGKWKVGERELMKVGPMEIDRKFDVLCNHLANPANRAKLQDLLRDIVDKEYLDGVGDDKAYSWLARIMELPVEFKKKEEVKERVYAQFVE